MRDGAGRGGAGQGGAGRGEAGRGGAGRFLTEKRTERSPIFVRGFSLGDATGDNIAKNEAERGPTREHFGAFWGPFGLFLESF